MLNMHRDIAVTRPIGAEIGIVVFRAAQPMREENQREGALRHRRIINFYRDIAAALGIVPRKRDRLDRIDDRLIFLVGDCFIIRGWERPA